MKTDNYDKRLRKAIDQNKGRVKVAIALNSAHKTWREKHDTNTKKIEKCSGKSLKTAPDEKHLGETKKSYVSTNIKEELNDDQKKMIANFRYLTWSISYQKWISKNRNS